MARPLRALADRSRGGLAVVGGAAAGQVLLLLAAPFISRLYSPADFGVFAVILACSTPAAVVFGLRYESAIPLPRDARVARALAAVSLGAVLASALMLSLVLLFFGQGISRLLSLGPVATDFLMWTPLVAGVTATYAVVSQAAVRVRRYRAIGWRHLLNAAATVILQLALGVLHFGPRGLIVGYAMGQLIGSLTILRALSQRGLRCRLAPTELTSAARRYWRFPLVMAPSAFLNALGLQVPVVMSTWLFGLSVAGWLGMAQRVLSVPITVIGLSMAQVYLGELAAKFRQDEDPLPLFRRASMQLASAAVLIAGLLLLAGPALFEAFLGQEWRTSGEYARALAFSMAMQLLASPLSQTLVVANRLGLQVTWDISRLGVTVGVFLLCASFGLGAEGTLWLVGATNGVLYALLWFLCRSSLRNRHRVG